jgi:hypothetical protein
VGIKEEKEKVRELVGGVVFCSEGPRDDFAANSPGCLGVWLVELGAAPPAEFCSVSTPSVRRTPLGRERKDPGELELVAPMGACPARGACGEDDVVCQMSPTSLPRPLLYRLRLLVKGWPRFVS